MQNAAGRNVIISNPMHLQPISNIAEIFYRKNITHVVISPGSRNAPLTLAFARHPEIEVHVIPDERSAGFIALGISQNLKQPVGVVCTSGSAAINLFPAIAEAYLQEAPLIIMTADRPPEWIDQWDGQTIYQQGLYGIHVKRSYTLPVDVLNKESETLLYRQISEGLNFAGALPNGPVHFNFPFREPFYPDKNEKIEYSKDLKIIDSENPECSLSTSKLEHLSSLWKSSAKKLILVGQNDHSENLLSVLELVAAKHKIPLVGDVLSNIHHIENSIRYSDIFLSGNKEKQSSLTPDLLITIGKSVISKNLKLFLRTSQIKNHWQVQWGQTIKDPFNSITEIIIVDPVLFLKEMELLSSGDDFINQKQSNFKELWHLEEHKAKKFLKSFFPQKKFGEWEATKEILGSLPQNSILHLANSMPVRWANFSGLQHFQRIDVYCNRGTSGIDGCTSTTMGFAITSQKPVVLITGDMAFLYDRNAFWHNYPYPLLRIVVLNNHGGGIFRLITGPDDQPELEEFFETKQVLKAESVAKEFNIDYHYAGSAEQLAMVWKEFFNFDGKPKLLEIETKGVTNQEIFRKFKEETEEL
jgi:2-succinyl-5-enolpyruvyl-6-hydroxy-3-cyclohexene-1-carboxylate synthase